MTVDLRNEPVLVTGASGFLGPHIIAELLKRGANVVGLDHDIKRFSYLQLEGLDRQIDMASGNITDLEDMNRVVGDYEVRYVFHCAADAIVRKCATDPVGAFRTNIMGTARLLEACRLVGTVKGVMCMESDKSYGSFDPKDLPYREDQALKPSNVYEVSKACAGLVAKAYDNNYDLPTYTIRGANLYGPGDMNLSRLIPGSILRILDGEPPVLYGGVENYIRELIYVKDGASAIVQLMEKIEHTRGHAINVGSGSTHRVGDVISEVCRAMGSSLEPRIVEREVRFKEIEKQWLDLTKLRGFLPDFSPADLEEGLAETVEWYIKFHASNTKKAD